MTKQPSLIDPSVLTDDELEYFTFTEDTNEGICPYCLHANHYEAEDMPYVEDEEREFRCTKCRKDFILVCTRVTYSRESRRKND